MENSEQKQFQFKAFDLEGLFDHPEQMAHALSALQQLAESPGWKILKEVMERNVVAIDEKLRDPDEVKTIEDLRLLQWRRYYQDKFVAVVDEMLSDLKDRTQLTPGPEYDSTETGALES